MPRTARIKELIGTYHIIIRSISEVLLFKSPQDKDKYLSILERYKQLYNFKLYGYCLMNNHAHFIIDSNGSDISMIMKSINQSYVSYFNKKYERHGHLFQDRFKSILVNNNEYLKRLSAYIHNNPKDIKKFKKSVEKYRYSSLGLYLGIRENTNTLVDTSYIVNLFGNKNFAKTYLEYMKLYANKKESSLSDDLTLEKDNYEYRSDKTVLIRSCPPDKIIEFVSSYAVPGQINVKYSRKNTQFRSLCVVLIRSLCNMKYKDIGKILGNLTQTSLCRLCNKGLDLIINEKRYSNIFSSFIKTANC